MRGIRFWEWSLETILEIGELITWVGEVADKVGSII